MKITEEQLDKAIASMSALELEQLVRNIVWSLYGEKDEETDVVTFDSEKNWEGHTIEDVASDIGEAGLFPDRIAERFPVSPS